MRRLAGVIARPLTSPLDPNLRPALHWSSLRTWRSRLGLVAVGELVWFALLHPLVPRTLYAACVLALVPLPLIAYALLVARVIGRLADTPWNLRLRQTVALGLALSVGVCVFAVLWLVETRLSGQLGYFWLHHQ